VRKITFAAIAAGALIPAAIAGWASLSNRPVQAEAATAIEAQIDTFSVMVNAKDLPVEAFEDLTLVFPSR
jgi:Flp pilus assembly protein CpaB